MFLQDNNDNYGAVASCVYDYLPDTMCKIPTLTPDDKNVCVLLRKPVFMLIDNAN